MEEATGKGSLIGNGVKQNWVVDKKDADSVDVKAGKAMHHGYGVPLPIYLM